MSTERPPAERRRFRRLSAALLAVLALVAASLAAVNLMQPPRLTAAEGSLFTLTEYAGTRVVLHLTQPVAPVTAEQLTITPAVPVEVESQGAEVTIRFLEPLDYATRYEIELSVTGAFTGVTGAVEHRIDTADAEVFTLLRSEAGDRIEAQGLSTGSNHRTVFEAGRIQEFARLSDRLFVVTLPEADRPELRAVVLADGRSTVFGPTTLTSISQLRVEPRTSFVGYLATGEVVPGQPLDRALLLSDGSASPGPPAVALGPDGEALSVAEWRFVPGSTAIAALTLDGRLLLLDPAFDREPVVLGGFDGMRGFLPNTRELVLLRGGEEVVLDLSGTGAASDAAGAPVAEPLALPAAPAHDDEVARTASGIANRIVLGRGTAVDRVVADDGVAQVRLVGPDVDDAGAAQALFAPASATSRIGAMCLSTNGRVLAVEVISAEGAPDGVPSRERFSATTSSFIELRTGRVLRSVNGTLSDGC